MQENFSVSHEEVNGITIVNPSGVIDDVSTCSFQSLLTELYREGRTAIVIDLSKVHYLVSSCLGLIINTARQLTNKGGKLCLCSPAGGVKTVLQTTRVFEQIEVYETQPEALAACRQTTC